ncbi:MAG: Hsp70 family protein [Myxococcales bacterium]|nr:Hsp70 family protein [Myxococcales bacterium]
MSEMSRFVIGIDLGTTNCAVAYVDLTKTEPNSNLLPDIHGFDIPQLTRLGHVEAKKTLPSFLYLAAEGELPPGSLSLPWKKDLSFAVGTLARDHGAKVPRRLVSSAKSWMSHGEVDRRAAFLPLGDTEMRRVSPVEAATSYLVHIRDAWDHVIAQQDPSLQFARQQILVTVPASFDPIARDLTIEATRLAGLPHVTLLEEPQAALYAWLASTGDAWRKEVHANDVILVCDVGGGTTDFSVIQVKDHQGDLVLERLAVGDHILLGGDNMDVALAHLAQQRLAQQGTQLDAWQSRELWHACRVAKEALLSDPGLQSFPVSVLGRGSRLIGGTIRTDLVRADIDVLLRGFFPECSITDRPQQRRTTGLREIGLPFAADAGVTRHLAEFLTRNAHSAGQNSGSFIRPSALLFNGGIFEATLLRDKLSSIVNQWLTADGAEPIRILRHQSLDLAVARGAAYYGLVRLGHGLRIRGGTARSYYVGIESSLPTVPGMAPPIKALCVAPFGTEEGTSQDVASREFGLVVGEPATFRLLSSTIRRDDPIGAMIDVYNDDEIRDLAPLETTLSGSGDDTGMVVPVHIRTHVTEIGTLEIWCVARDGERKWKLEFNIREDAG